MRGLLVALVLFAISLAGCGGPYASDAQAPAGREGETFTSIAAASPATLSTTMRVTSLPAETIGTATGEPVNCFYLGPEDPDEEMGDPLDGVNVSFTWADEVPGSGSSLSASVYNLRDHATTVTGQSPLEVHADSTSLPLMLPLSIRVEPNGPIPVSIAQPVQVEATVFGYSGALMVWPISCLE
ncbi:MAG: hypothetical protein WC876_04715 [Candidatus Thermoplasmatota archaeon]|jgi:hypothetical protein